MPERGAYAGSILIGKQRIRGIRRSVPKTTSERPQSGPVTPLSSNRPFLSQSAGRDFCFFAGMVIGFYNAPIKKGISVTCGNNNTIEKEKKRREA